MINSDIEILKRAFEREKAARKQAESILEQKSGELYSLTLELKKTNSALEQVVSRKSNELKGVFENINDAFVISDLKGNVLRMNDSARDLFGFVHGKDNQNLLSIVHPDDFDKSILAFNELLVKGHISNIELKITTSNSSVKYLHLNSSLIYENDLPVGAQGIARDMTEYHRTKELMEEQKYQLDIIVDNSSFGILLTQDGFIKTSNKAFRKLLGYEKKQLENLPFKDIIRGDNTDEFLSLFEKMNAGELEVFSMEKGFTKKDGSSVFTKTTVNAVRNFNGKIKYKVIVIENITKDLENKLMLDVLNTTAKAILGKVNALEISSEIVKIVGNYLGTPLCEFYLNNKENNQLMLYASFGDAGVQKDVAEGLSIPYGIGIVGNVAKNGVGEIINDVSNDPRHLKIFQGARSEIAVPIISNDVVLGVIDSESPVKNFFSESHLKTLTNVARIVSLQLANALSIEAKDKAEAKNQELMSAIELSNRELQEYAHVVSHDLKSPLRSIHALVSWLKEDNISKLDDQSIQNISMIETTVENMEQLISDVLEYSSVSANKLNVEDVDLDKVVKSIIVDLQPSTSVSIQLVKKLPKVKGDKTRFKQLFQNLISNGIKYNNKENGYVKIDYSRTKTHHNFTIEDNGIGIEKKYFEKIFQIFQALRPSKESTGVGLSIVKKIINIYEGKIWLESEVGKGSKFHFTIKKS